MQLKPKSMNSKGVAIITALALLLVVSGLLIMIGASSLNQVKNSNDNLAITQTLALARGGANLAARALGGEFKASFAQLIENKSSSFNTSDAWVFGGNGNKPNPVSVINDLQSVTTDFQAQLDAVFCSTNVTPLNSTAKVSLRVYVTETSCTKSITNYGLKIPSPRFISGQSRNSNGAEAVPQTYAIPYVMVAEGSSGEYKRNIILQGEYQFTFGRGSFAKYALFTNVHTSSSGGAIWFTDDTLFDGPVHTNQYFRYYRNPWFNSTVTSAGCTSPQLTVCSGGFGKKGAEFYASGFYSQNNILPSSPFVNNSYGTHGPIMNQANKTPDFGSGYVVLPQNSNDQKTKAQANGIYFNGNIDQVKLWACDDNGNEDNNDADFQCVKLEGQQNIVTIQNVCQTVPVQYYYYDSKGKKKYYTVYEQQCNDVSVTTTVPYTENYRIGKNKKLEKLSSGTWANPGGIQDKGQFNGIVYVDGSIQQLTGPSRSPSSSTNPDNAGNAIAGFSKLTVVAKNDIRITGDLKYESPPCSSGPVKTSSGVTPAVCNNKSVTNILGVYVDDGDILIGNNNASSALNAPYNVTINAVLMSGKGSVTVENYDQGSARGDVRLTGGLIEYYYGAFGTFNANTGGMGTGYSRKFTYDPRMSEGISPPFFPTIQNDEVQGVFVTSYGQREQIY